MTTANKTVITLEIYNNTMPSKTLLEYKIKRYKEWNVDSVESVKSFNSRQTELPMFFRRPSTHELYKKGVVVSISHKQGGRANILLKGKLDAILFTSALNNK